jgi:hypothetical protein
MSTSTITRDPLGATGINERTGGKRAAGRFAAKALKVPNEGERDYSPSIAAEVLATSADFTELGLTRIASAAMSEARFKGTMSEYARKVQKNCGLAFDLTEWYHPEDGEDANNSSPWENSPECLSYARETLGDEAFIALTHGWVNDNLGHSPMFDEVGYDQYDGAVVAFEAICRAVDVREQGYTLATTLDEAWKVAYKTREEQLSGAIDRFELQESDFEYPAMEA